MLTKQCLYLTLEAPICISLMGLKFLKTALGMHMLAIITMTPIQVRITHNHT
jgi:hypothetical protein